MSEWRLRIRDPPADRATNCGLHVDHHRLEVFTQTPAYNPRVFKLATDVCQRLLAGFLYFLWSTIYRRLILQVTGSILAT